MIQIIAGEKGKGKTKILLEKVNREVLAASGNVVYLDKNSKHMYELSNKVRLINVKDYLIDNYHEFLGFICGILSQDHDLEKIYLDSLLKVACAETEGLPEVLRKLEEISDLFHVEFVVSISLRREEIPEAYQNTIIVAL